MREKQWAGKYPELGTGPVPAEPMFSEEHFALERDRIFRRTWINLDDYFGGSMPARAHRLYLMSLSLVEVATLVELYKRPGAVDACDPLRFVRKD